MRALKDFILDGTHVAGHSPWPRVHVSPTVWEAAIAQLSANRWTLLGLWGEPDMVYMAVRDPEAGDIAVISLACADGNYPSVARHHPPALRLERAIHDLFGLRPVGLPDKRPWLDHGCWGVKAPLASQPRATDTPAAPYTFLGAEGSGLTQVPVGPVHAGIIEPGHFRFTTGGETVVRLEERFGYTHKGVESLMAGATLPAAARLAGRVSGDSTLAYALAFAKAVESALALAVPARAVWLRALMAEIERLANHIGDIGAICNDAGFAFLHVRTAVLREQILRVSAACFGHRMMKDTVVPGGLAAEPHPDSAERIRQLLDTLRDAFPALVRVYDNNASILERTSGAGYLSGELAAQFGAGGYVGRGSGRDFDARRDIGYTPYDQLPLTVAKRSAGDVNARIWVRIDEVNESLRLIDHILAHLPGGPVRVDLPRVQSCREGMALVEGFRGDILVWLRLGADGRIKRCHLRDPSWFQWPLLEAVIEGNIIADFPLCNKSFNCSYSGHDL